MNKTASSGADAILKPSKVMMMVWRKVMLMLMHLLLLLFLNVYPCLLKGGVGMWRRDKNECGSTLAATNISSESSVRRVSGCTAVRKHLFMSKWGFFGRRDDEFRPGFNVRWPCRTDMGWKLGYSRLFDGSICIKCCRRCGRLYICGNGCQSGELRAESEWE